MAGELMQRDSVTPSEKLLEYLQQQEQVLFPEVGNINSLVLTENFGEEVRAKLWGLFDLHEQHGMAARVLQGFCIVKLREHSEGDFVAGLQQRGYAVSDAYRLIDTFALFNALPDLSLMHRASALGATRLRELKISLGMEGLRGLIAGNAVAGLTYDHALSLDKQSLVKWGRDYRRELRNQRKLALDESLGIEPSTDPEHRELRSSVIAREECIAATQCAVAHIASLKSVFARLLKPAGGDDLWKLEAAALLQAQLDEVVREADELRAANRKRFGGRVAEPEFQPHRQGRHAAILDSAMKDALLAVEDIAGKRAQRRHKAHRWVGSPTKSLDSAIEAALKADAQHG